MKGSYRCLICAALFLLFTAVKLVSPAAASDIKASLLPILDRNDDYHHVLSRIEDRISPRNSDYGALVLPEPPLDRIQTILESPRENPMAAYPKTVDTPAPEPEEPQTDPALEFGLQARETFLRTQAEVTEQQPPENVSYEVLSLPFAETSPVSGDASSGFGYRVHPIQDTLRFHYGTDFAADEGTDVLCFADGTVLSAGWDDGYGNFVKVDHGDGFVTLYGHCSALLVTEGETVTKGERIALVGSTGQSTGPHLHFELIHDGIYLNPEFYLYA